MERERRGRARRELPTEPEGVWFVRETSYESCTESVRHLAHQEDDSSVIVVEIQDLTSLGQINLNTPVLPHPHLVEEEQEVGEPHGGTEVIEDMSESVAKLLAQ